MGWCRAEIFHADGSRTVLAYGERVDPLSEEAPFTNEQRLIEENPEHWRGIASGRFVKA